MAIQKYGGTVRLMENQLYQVSFQLDGVSKQFSFTSRYSPLYTTIKILRNDFRDLFENIKDNTLNFQIWQTSLLANEIANEDSFLNGKPNFAVKQYVRFKTEYDVVRNILIAVSSKAGSEDKKLGEFSITREFKTPDIEAILKDLGAELKKWESAISDPLQNRGAVRANTNFPFSLASRVSF